MYHYKDRNPEDTIKLFKSKLEELGLTFEEDFYETPSGTWSSTLLCREFPHFNSSGKGLTKDLCRASAYGEFIEVLENFPRTVSPDYIDISDFKFFPDEKKSYSSLEELPDFIIKDMTFLNNGNSDLTTSLFIEKSLDSCVPFRRLNDNTYHYLPYDVIEEINHTNGSASGNSYEEACVEAVSEILERYVYRKILENKLTPPEIDRYFLSENYPDLFTLFLRTETILNVEIKIYDCSLGLGYPVLCMVSLNKENHTYKSKFGSHPLFEIALERCLTEFYQNFSEDTFILTSVSPNKANDIRSSNPSSVLLSFLRGINILPKEFFKKESSWSFKDWYNFNNYTNEKGLSYFVKLFDNQKIDLYVRSNDWLNIPAVYVYIPEMSLIKANYSFKSQTESNNYNKFIRDAATLNTCVKEHQVERAINFYEQGSSFLFLNDKRTEHDILIKYLIDAKRFKDSLRVLNSLINIDKYHACLKDIIEEIISRNNIKETFNIMSNFYDDRIINWCRAFIYDNDIKNLYNLDNRKIGLITRYSSETLDLLKIKEVCLNIKNKMKLNIKGAK